MAEQINGLVASICAVSDMVVRQLVAGVFSRHLVHLHPEVHFPLHFSSEAITIIIVVTGVGIDMVDVTVLALKTMIVIVDMAMTMAIAVIPTRVFRTLFLPKVRKVIPHGISLRQIQANGRVFRAQVCNVDLGNVFLVHNDEPHYRHR